MIAHNQSQINSVLFLQKAEGKLFRFFSSSLFFTSENISNLWIKKARGGGFEQDSDKAVVGIMWCYLSFFWTLPACLCPVVILRQLLLKASLANQSWQVAFLVPGVDNRYLLWSPISCITKRDGEFSICWQQDDRWHLLAQHSSCYHLKQLLCQFMCLLVRNNCRFRTWKLIALCRLGGLSTNTHTSKNHCAP